MIIESNNSISLCDVYAKVTLVCLLNCTFLYLKFGRWTEPRAGWHDDKEVTNG